MNEPRLDIYPLDYDDVNHAGMCEFTKTYIAYFFNVYIRYDVCFHYRKRRIFCD